MAWVVILGNRAERNLKRVPAADRARILAAVEEMGTEPLGGDVVKLKGQGQGAFRRRVGSYRVIFSIDFQALAVGILDIQRRKSTTY